MGIIKNGLHGPFIGRVDNIVYYMLGDKNVSRKIGKSTKPRTDKQLRNQALTKVCSMFFCAVRDFIETGFSIEARMAKDNAYNQAVKYNKQDILIGNFPDLEFNFEKILLSKGDLNPAENPEVIQIPMGLQFNWETDPKMAWPEAADQAMVIAYFPEQNRTAYELYGNNRISGSVQLEISPSLQGAYMETYLSFISADRTRIANSVYTGSFNKPEAEDQSLKLS